MTNPFVSCMLNKVRWLILLRDAMLARDARQRKAVDFLMAWIARRYDTIVA